MKNQGQYVLENRMGQIVRTFHWEREQLKLVYRQDTRRIETFGSNQEMNAELLHKKIPFQLIAEVTREEVKKKPVQIGDVGQLRWIENAQVFSPQHEMPESKENLNRYLKWTAAVQVGLVLMVLGLNSFLSLESEKLPTQTVTVIPQEMIELPPTTEPPKAARKRETVAPSKTRVAKNVTVAPTQNSKPRLRAAKTPPAKIEKWNFARRIKGGGPAFGTANGKGQTKSIGFAGPENSISQTGALGVLSSATSSTKNSRFDGGGLNLKAIKNERGTGLGGGPGTGNGNGGGNPHALLGRGLVAAAPGIGNGSGHGIGTPGAVGSGYGTRGKGHGGGGYGTYRLGGSAKGSSQYAGNGIGNGAYKPHANSAYGDEDDISVAGGLSRDQIADVINRHMGQVTYCYEQGLQVKPSLAGRLAVQFVIGGQGHVNVANVGNSSLRSAQVESCIVTRLKSWKFPKPVGNVNVKVTYPFVLKRVSQG